MADSTMDSNHPTDQVLVVTFKHTKSRVRQKFWGYKIALKWFRKTLNVFTLDLLSLDCRNRG